MTYPALPAFKRGAHGYATILAHVRAEPCTAHQLAERACGITYTNAHRLLRQLRHHRLIHISGWVRESGRGPHCAVFSLGSDLDVPPPPAMSDDAKRLSSAWASTPPPVRAEILAFAAVWRELESPQSSLSLMESCGGSRNSLKRLLNHMHALGLVRIAAWDRTASMNPAACYQRGRASDARRPKPLTVSEMNRRYDAGRRARNQTIRMNQLTAGPLALAA